MDEAGQIAREPLLRSALVAAPRAEPERVEHPSLRRVHRVVERQRALEIPAADPHVQLRVTQRQSLVEIRGPAGRCNLEQLLSELGHQTRGGLRSRGRGEQALRQIGPEGLVHGALR